MSKNAINPIVYLLFFSFMLIPTTSKAVSAFDPNYILSDAEMRDIGSWQTADVQDFLNNNKSYLKNYQAIDVIDNKTKTASQIIYDAALRYEISPKVLLVTLQKEQSLITDTTPSQTQLDWATGYAVCDSCSTKDPKVLKHKGFATQVDDAAYTFDWYYENKSAGNVKKMGVAHSIDGQTVMPKTWATAFLYTYTPHLHGNENFWTIWQKWFKQNYPNGSLLKSEASDDIWLIQNGVKRKFKNMSVLITRADPKMIITVPNNVISNYSTGAELSFPNYSLLKSAGKYYLLDYDTLRPFDSEKTVWKLGYNPQEVLDVTNSDIAGLKTGTTIKADAYAPQGIIYKITDFGDQLYLVKDGVASPLLDKTIAETSYKNLTIEAKTLADLRQLELRDNLVAFKDGAVFKQASTDNYFVIENGKKRKFESVKTFTSLGYKDSNLVELDSISTFMIPSGENIYFTASFDVAKLNEGSGSGFLGDLATNVEDKYKTTLPAYIVAEYPSGKIIAGKNIDTKRPIASFVKTFVGYEALQQGLDLTKTATYNSSEHNAEGYSLWVANGTQITNKDVLNTMMIGSYNNFAKMTTKMVGLTEKEMVTKVNERFKTWGTKNTTVADVTGLSENNISTPRDLLKIFTYSLNKSSDMYIISGKKRHDFSSINTGRNFSVNNSNILSFDNADYKILSSKTGYTDEALSVLYLLVQSKKTNQRYSIITMGNPDYTNRFYIPDKIAKWVVNNSSLNLANN